MDREIPAEKQQADYVIAAVEQYDDLGGKSALKAVHIYEHDMDVQAQYRTAQQVREMFLMKGICV